jgi:hypothetical protein
MHVEAEGAKRRVGFRRREAWRLGLDCSVLKFPDGLGNRF